MFLKFFFSIFLSVCHLFSLLLVGLTASTCNSEADCSEPPETSSEETIPETPLESIGSKTTEASCPLLKKQNNCLRKLYRQRLCPVQPLRLSQPSPATRFSLKHPRPSCTQLGKLEKANTTTLMPSSIGLTLSQQKRHSKTLCTNWHNGASRTTLRYLVSWYYSGASEWPTGLFPGCMPSWSLLELFSYLRRLALFTFASLSYRISYLYRGMMVSSSSVLLPRPISFTTVLTQRTEALASHLWRVANCPWRCLQNCLKFLPTLVLIHFKSTSLTKRWLADQTPHTSNTLTRLISVMAFSMRLSIVLVSLLGTHAYKCKCPTRGTTRLSSMRFPLLLTGLVLLCGTVVGERSIASPFIVRDDSAVVPVSSFRLPLRPDSDHQDSAQPTVFIGQLAFNVPSVFMSANNPNVNCIKHQYCMNALFSISFRQFPHNEAKQQYNPAVPPTHWTLPALSMDLTSQFFSDQHADFYWLIRNDLFAFQLCSKNSQQFMNLLNILADRPGIMTDCEDNSLFITMWKDIFKLGASCPYECHSVYINEFWKHISMTNNDKRNMSCQQTEGSHRCSFQTFCKGIGASWRPGSPFESACPGNPNDCYLVKKNDEYTQMPFCNFIPCYEKPFVDLLRGLFQFNVPGNQDYNATLMELCDIRIGTIRQQFVSSSYLDIDSRLHVAESQTAAFGRVSLALKTAYTCEDWLNAKPLLTCAGRILGEDCALGQFRVPNSGDPVFDIVPPKNLRFSMQSQKLSLACDWTKLFELSFLVDLFFRKEFIDKLMLYYEVTLEDHAVELLQIQTYEIESKSGCELNFLCPSNLKLHLYTTGGTTYASSDAVLADYKRFGGLVKYNDKQKVVLDKTHYSFTGSILEIWGMMWSKKDLVVVDVNITNHHYQQCYAPINPNNIEHCFTRAPACDSCTFRAVGIQRNKMIMYTTDHSPSTCELIFYLGPTPYYHKLRSGNIFFFDPSEQLFDHQGNKIILPKPPVIVDDFTAADSKVKVNYSILTIAGQFLDLVEAILSFSFSDILEKLKSLAYPITMFILIYFAARKNNWIALAYLLLIVYFTLLHGANAQENTIPEMKGKMHHSFGISLECFIGLTILMILWLTLQHLFSVRPLPLCANYDFTAKFYGMSKTQPCACTVNLNELAPGITICTGCFLLWTNTGVTTSQLYSVFLNFCNTQPPAEFYCDTCHVQGALVPSVHQFCHFHTPCSVDAYNYRHFPLL